MGKKSESSFAVYLNSFFSNLLFTFLHNELGIKVPFSKTHLISNIGKNQNLYPHQSRITLPGLL